MAKSKKTRYGLHYISNGRWTTQPYHGVTFTKHTLNTNPLKAEINLLKNHILKSRVKILPAN
jgi:hypothetical protein